MVKFLLRVLIVGVAGSLSLFSESASGFQEKSETSAPAEHMTNSAGIEMKLIPAGNFAMGSRGDQFREAPEEHPQIEVNVSKPFYISVREVTQKEWFDVMGTKPWLTDWNSKRLYVREGDNFPASYVSWRQAVSFCEKLSAREKACYRLPSEIEWEYCCRAGAQTPFSISESGLQPGDYGWFAQNTVSDMYSLYHREVGGRKANAFGLYDMHGNVWEWCGDVFDPQRYSSGAPQPVTGLKVLRGGAWFYNTRDGRSTIRGRLRADYAYSSSGLRLVKDLECPKPPDKKDPDKKDPEKKDPEKKDPEKKNPGDDPEPHGHECPCGDPCEIHMLPAIHCIPCPVPSCCPVPRGGWNILR